MKYLKEEIEDQTERQTKQNRWLGKNTEGWWNENPISLAPVHQIFKNVASLRSIPKSGGLILDERHCLVHQLNRQQLDDLTKELARFGFRIAAVVHSDLKNDSIPESHWMALWKRDNREAYYLLEATAEELKKVNREYVEQGFVPDHASGYSLDNYQTFLFNTIWTTTPPLPFVVKGDMYVDVPGPQHRELGWGPFTDEGYIPRLGITRALYNPEHALTSIRWKLREGIRYIDAWSKPMSFLDTVKEFSPGALLVQANPTVESPSKANRGLTTIWWYGLAMESQRLPPQPVSDHRRHCQEMLERGFRIQDIHSEIVDGFSTPQYSSIWWRPQNDVIEESKFDSRIARLMLAELELGSDSDTIQGLQQKESPGLRGHLIHSFNQCKISADWLVEKVLAPDQESIKCDLIEALLNYRSESISMNLKLVLQNTLPELNAKKKASPALRSLLERLIATWQLDAKRDSIENSHDDLTSVDGHRLIVIHPTRNFWIGSKDKNQDGITRKNCCYLSICLTISRLARQRLPLINSSNMLLAMNTPNNTVRVVTAP